MVVTTLVVTSNKRTWQYRNCSYTVTTTLVPVKESFILGHVTNACGCCYCCTDDDSNRYEQSRVGVRHVPRNSIAQRFSVAKQTCVASFPTTTGLIHHFSCWYLSKRSTSSVCSHGNVAAKVSPRKTRGCIRCSGSRASRSLNLGTR